MAKKVLNPCAESEGGLADPISSMLACEPQDGLHSVVWKARLLTAPVGDADDQADASLAVVESRSKGGAVSLRVEARNRQPEGALLPDKMVLTPPNSSINATESVPWAMLELWAALWHACHTLHQNPFPLRSPHLDALLALRKRMARHQMPFDVCGVRLRPTPREAWIFIAPGHRGSLWWRRYCEWADLSDDE